MSILVCQHQWGSSYIVDPDAVPVAVVFPVPVADPEVDVEEGIAISVRNVRLEESGIILQIVTDAEARQVAEYTLIAADSASPEHFSVMFPMTCDSRDPQRDLRSAGLVWALRG